MRQTPSRVPAFACGGLDHVIANCPRTRQVQAIQSCSPTLEPEVLFIGSIADDMSKRQEPTSVSSRSRSVSSRSRKVSSSFGVVRSGVKTSNQFQALAEEACEELSICEVENLEMQDKSMVCRLVEWGTVSQVVQQQGEWVHLGFGEIAVDCAANESCWPMDEGGALRSDRPSGISSSKLQMVRPCSMRERRM